MVSMPIISTPSPSPTGILCSPSFGLYFDTNATVQSATNSKEIGAEESGYYDGILVRIQDKDRIMRRISIGTDKQSSVILSGYPLAMRCVCISERPTRWLPKTPKTPKTSLLHRSHF
mmetsp:Transcript_26604/g.48920  ORF Transcript_26604/g.48920 Transcript_26604/m.48920 type:complete len:117 (+) Transcript_26604:94-444(+)